MEVKSVNKIKETIEYIREGLNEWRYHNEESVKQGMVLPILHSLGWNIYDTKTVVPGYNVCGKLVVDYAICQDFYKENPQILIDVKGIDKSLQKIIFEKEIEKIRNIYCKESNVNYAIYVDGIKWYFLSTKNNKIFLLNLLEDDIDKLVGKFSEYLSYDKCKTEPLTWNLKHNIEKPETEKSSFYIDTEHIISCVLHLRGKEYPIHTRAATTKEGWRNVLVEICRDLITKEGDIQYFTTSPIFSGSIKNIFKSVEISNDYKEISPGFYFNTNLRNNGFGKRLRMLMRYFNIASKEVYFTNIVKKGK